MDGAQILNIRILSDELAEVDPSDPRRALKKVPRSDFVSGRILVTRVSERPILVTLIALPLLAIGALMTASVIHWLVYGGVHRRSLITMVLLVPGGLWLLWDAWRRAPCLDRDAFRFAAPRDQGIERGGSRPASAGRE